MVVGGSQHLQRLLPLLHRSPVATAEINAQGALCQVNPKCLQLMMPLAAHLGLPGDNLLDILTGFLPSVGDAIVNYDEASGIIIDQHPYIIQFSVAQNRIERYFSLTVDKQTPDSLLVFFDDVTDFLIKVDTLRHDLDN